MEKWRLEHPHDTPPQPLTPSPTPAHTSEDLPRLRFTEQIVTEAMRLYPPAWTIGRQAVSDCEIGGYPVQAGTTLYMSQWVIHRDPRYFENPTQFYPDRWSGDCPVSLTFRLGAGLASALGTALR